MNTTNKASSRTLRVLTTTTLIRRFHEQCPLDELYDKAVRSYETLIDVIQNPASASEISALLNIPEDTIKHYAEAIIDILLFNNENDPYLSFGLKRYAPFSEVNRRWKSLIVLYHPDKYLNQKIFEDKAKKINEIYGEIQQMQEQRQYSKSLNTVSGMSHPKNDQAYYVRYLKNIPYIIIALAIIIAILSILLFFFNSSFASFYPSAQEGNRKASKIIRIDLESIENHNLIDKHPLRLP